MSYEEIESVIPFSTLPDPTNRFIVDRVIAKGVHSEVYLGFDKENDKREVAIKVVENIKEVIDGAEEEFRTLTELSDHPNFPKFYGCFMVRDGNPDLHQLWFVMEYIVGGSIMDLSRNLKQNNVKLPESVISYVLLRLINAVAHLHQVHIMSRDIKGDNILLKEDGQVVLVDFGLARHLDCTLERRCTSIGTPYWMAPEVIECAQLPNTEYDCRSDVWSIGITAIEIADSQPPLADLHPMRAMIQIVRNPPPGFRRMSEWSQDFGDFISECLVKNPEHRPLAEELLEHPFILETPDDTALVQEEIVNLLNDNALIRSKKESIKPSTQVTAFINHLMYDPGTPPQLMVPDDLASMNEVTQESVLETLYSRYRNGQYYAWVADVLVAMNHFSDLPIYNKKTQEKYDSKTRSDNDPHIFAVADKAHQDMIHNKEHQTIILTGESGSGKTFNFNKLILHLLQLGESNPGLIEKVRMIPIVLDAFGNAVTQLNQNATRHCRFFDITFSSTGKISGAIIWIMMLEKFRVTQRPQNEGNFHIFYYLYDGLSQTSRLNRYGLKVGRLYEYLKRHPYDNEVTNAKNFRSVEKAFEVLGFEENEVNTIFSILAAILILGNVEFGGKEKAKIIDMDPLLEVCRLLGVDSKKMSWALCNYCKIRGGTTLEPCSKSRTEAIVSRDTLAQTLYTRLVDHIVNTINKNLSVTRLVFGDPGAIGVVDMFGFEANEINSLENFFVNVANEQVQYFYNQFMFSWEMQDYEEEGIPVKNFSFPDNRHILELFLSKGCGLFSLLEDETREDEGSDAHLIRRFSKISSSQMQKVSETTFAVSHYVGRVKYDIKGFVEKNRDVVSPEIVQTLRKSSKQAVRKMFTFQLSKTGNLVAEGSSKDKPTENLTYKKDAPKGPRRYNTKSKGKLSQTRHTQTNGLTFRYSLIELLYKLTKSSPHFVRCMLPNMENSSSMFDHDMMQHQIKYHGILDTIKIRQQGFSHRIDFKEFLRRYKFLAFDFDERVDLTKENARLLLLRLKMEGWAIGESKVFLKYYNEEYLSRLYEKSVKKIVKIQAMMRTFMMIKRRRKGAIGCTSTGNYANKDKAATVIQSRYRGYYVRKTCDFSKGTDPGLPGRPDVLDVESAKFIQYYFRKWKMKTLFQALQMYRADKQQQLVFFSQQVHLYGQEIHAKLQRQNSFLDYDVIKSEAIGGHRFLLTRSQTPLPKLSLDHALNAYFDTTYLCDPTRSKKGRLQEDDWEAPFKTRSPASVSRAQNMGINYTIEEKNHSEGQESSRNIPKIIEPGSNNPATVSNFQPKNFAAGNKSPPSFGQKLSPELKYARKVTKPKSDTFEQSSSVPVFNKYPVSYLNKGPAPKPPVVVNTWESRSHNGYNSSTVDEPSSDFRYHSREALEEMQQKARNDGNEEGSPFNFQSMLRKTNYSRESMKRTSGRNTPDSRTPSPSYMDNHMSFENNNYGNQSASVNSFYDEGSIVAETEEALL